MPEPYYRFYEKCVNMNTESWPEQMENMADVSRLTGEEKKEVSGMISFLLCLAILIVGYFVYGKIVDNTFGPDDRETPAS